MKILSYTDLAIREEELFWHRDLGLLTKAFRDLGHEAWLVVHPASESPSKIKNPKTKISKEPVIWASPSDVRNPSWWRSQKPDLIILGLWTRPKYNPIRRAALSATPRVFERADSDGMRTASCGLRTYARRRYDYFRDHTFSWPQPLSALCSCLYSAISVLACPWMERRITETLRLIPDLVVETRCAAESWRSLACRLKAATRVHHIPHPVQTDLFRYHGSGLKQKRVISVGRWHTYQKNLPFLLSVLRIFLERHPDWSGMVGGSGLRQPSPHPRIAFTQNLAPADLAERMRASRIFFFSSRYESFLLAGAEALGAGCSVVGPETLVATQQLVEIQGCAPTTSRNLLEGLEAEYQAWEEGNRSPFKISQRACGEFSSQAVAQRFISLAGSS
ncbi:MAG: glycosyltransferase [Verrucomicrobiota bacterium]